MRSAIMAYILNVTRTTDESLRFTRTTSSLGDRYPRIRTMADLEETIRMAREAVDALALDDPDRAELLHNLGIRLSDRYSCTGATADLEEAISGDIYPIPPFYTMLTLLSLSSIQKLSISYPVFLKQTELYLPYLRTHCCYK